jgi:hypothetical protein
VDRLRGDHSESVQDGEGVLAESEIEVRVRMFFFLGFLVGAYVPVTVAGLMPEWVHAGLFLMAWLALGYPRELAALARGKEGARAEPLAEREAFAVRARFARARREEALRRERQQAWQRGMPHGTEVGAAY